MRHAIVLRKMAGKLPACSAGSPLRGGTALARPSLLGTALAIAAVLFLPLVALAAAAVAFLLDPMAGVALATAPVAMDSAKIRDEILGAFEKFKQANDERLEKIEKAKPVDTLLIEQVEKINDRLSEMEAAKNRAELGAKTPATDPEKTAAFNAWARTGVKPQGALSIGTDSAGGYTVPDEFERTLLQKLLASNVMRGICNVIPSISGTKEIPVVTAHGTATWTSEGVAHTESDETFATVTLGAHKVSRLIKVSKELLNDSAFDLVSYLAGEFARSVGATEETAFVVGNGTAKPTGFTTQSTLGKTAASATAVTADELIDLQHALGVGYRATGKARFMAADASIKNVRKLKGTDGQYIWQPSLQVGTPSMLLGAPVTVSENMPAMAAGLKSWAFGVFDYYWIADRVGFSMQRLDERYAELGQVGFIGERRVDGKLVDTSAIVHLAQL